MQTPKYYNTSQLFRCDIKGGGACKSTPVHAVQFHRLFPNKHFLLQVLWPSQQHCHFTSVHPALTNSSLTHTEGTLAAVSLSLIKCRGPPSAISAS